MFSSFFHFGLYTTSRISYIAVPLFVVLPVFKNCEVDAGEPVAYFCIMRIISSVSANVYLL